MGLVVRVLGPVGIERSGALEVPGPKPRLLLAVLAAHRGRVVSVDRLCDALWGDEQPPAAVATLQSHVSRLRRALAPVGEVVGVDGGYRLDLPAGALDVDAFEAASRRADGEPDPAAGAAHYAEALSWWRGPAFGELAAHPALRAEAVRLEELCTARREEWVERRLAAGGDAALVGDLDALVADHPLRERFVGQLMTALYREGRQGEALRRAADLRAVLRDEMGLEPSAELRTLEQRILADDAALRAPAAAARTAPTGRRAPVLDDPTRLVGRESDLTRLAHAVGRDRLVTLVGPGGVGKTRMARRVAASADGYRDGVAFVELAAVSDASRLDDALATALDVQPQLRLTMAETIESALAERDQLVVLDNCEHLLDALVPLVDRLRARCAHVHVLATSREPLGLPGEAVLTVAPLAVAPPEVADPVAVAEAHAVQLLVERVAAAVPGFAVTGDNAAALAEICRRLDGLPLALELVAARFRSLAPETILQRLVPAVVLGTSMRSADRRHRTLRDTIEWSYSHLTPHEQRLFARLSVFAGSFDLDAVEAVCGAEGIAAEVDLVEVLAGLVDKSMVQLVHRGRARYQLLQTLREFGRERRRDLDPAGSTDDAHLRWFVGLAERAALGLTGPDEAAWSRRIEDDLDDHRAAFDRAVAIGDADAALRLVAGLREYAFRRIRYELTSWAATALTLPGAQDHPRHAVVLAIVAYGHLVRGDLDAAVAVALDAAELGTDGNDSRGLAERTLGNALGFLGRFDDAMGWMDRMVASARTGSPARLAHALYMRSVAETSVGRTVRGAILAGEAHAAAGASGSPTALASASYALGIALESSEPEESLRLFREAATLAAGAGNRWIEAFAQTEVWWLEAGRGDVRRALVGSAAVIDTWHRGGDWINLRLSLRRVVRLLGQAGEDHAAAVVYGALTVAGAISALPDAPAGAEDLRAIVERVRAALGDDGFEAALAAGAARSEPELVAFVHETIARVG